MLGTEGIASNIGTQLGVQIIAILCVVAWTLLLCYATLSLFRWFSPDDSLRTDNIEMEMFGEDVEEHLKEALRDVPRGKICVAFTDIQGSNTYVPIFHGFVPKHAPLNHEEC